MNLDVKKLEKNYIEIALVDEDISLADSLREIVTNDKDVEFASARLEHPQIGHPVLAIRTKTKDPIDLLIDAAAKLKIEADEFKDALKAAKKTK